MFLDQVSPSFVYDAVVSCYVSVSCNSFEFNYCIFEQLSLFSIFLCSPIHIQYSYTGNPFDRTNLEYFWI